jgi:hypothetical protein
MNSFLFLHPCRGLAYRRVTGKGKVRTDAALHHLRTIAAVTMITACMASVTASAQNAAADSLGCDDESCRFKATQLIVPSALIVTSAVGVCNGWFHSVNNGVKDGMEGWRKDKYLNIDDYLQYLPIAANVGLGLAGLKPRHPFKERIACTATAYIAMGIMVNVTKIAVGEKRPDSNAHNSFPSGNTATAFMGAELVRKEYGNTAGFCAYAIAASVAVMRMYNNLHWLNDVIAGAGMGILSAKIGFWLLPWEKRLFGWDKAGNGTALVPCFNIHDNSLILTFYTAF